MKILQSLSARLSVALLFLLLFFGGLEVVISQRTARLYQDESLQQLSHGLAQHIVEHWPEIAAPDRDTADAEARKALLSMLKVVNPGVQVYVLDADGRVSAYIGPAGMVRRDHVDLRPVRSFLAGARLPLRGTDPMGAAAPRLFSAAMFPARAGDARPAGYLYIVLDGPSREDVAAKINERRLSLAAGGGVLVTLTVGLIAFGFITLPLQQLSRRIHGYRARASEPGAAGDRPEPSAGDGNEIQAIATAFDEMTLRIEAQAGREQEHTKAHLETMAGVAHDLRTPLTALHGHLEVLAGAANTEPGRRERLLSAALGQSEKVGRLSQQLFELATLRLSDRAPMQEAFSLDELVTDTVRKFELTADPGPVTLGGEPPGRLEVLGDLQLVERALTNLIDNALRHAPGPTPVTVSLRRAGSLAEILIEDHGPGLPFDLLQRLESGQSVREPPLARAGGGIGGLGLAIAQRVAELHGGGLRAINPGLSGTRLCMALALEPQPVA